MTIKNQEIMTRRPEVAGKVREAVGRILDEMLNESRIYSGYIRGSEELTVLSEKTADIVLDSFIKSLEEETLEIKIGTVHILLDESMNILENLGHEPRLSESHSKTLSEIQDDLAVAERYLNLDESDEPDELIGSFINRLIARAEGLLAVVEESQK